MDLSQMRRVKTAFLGEFQHFNRLNEQGKKLLRSIFIFNSFQPVFNIFVSAFLWRQSHNMHLVGFYNLSVFSTMTLGMYIAGLLLKKFKPVPLYFASAIIQGLCVFALIFLPTLTLLTAILFGLMFGLGAGIYWANRNLLVLHVTTRENRIFFTSMDTTLFLLYNIVIPFVVGWLIIFGTFTNLYPPIYGYYILALLSLITMASGWFVLKDLSVEKPPIARIMLTRPSKKWSQARLINFINGLLNGIVGFAPILMILTLVGQENILGTIQSLAALITGVLLYSFAKSIKPKHRVKIIAIGTFCSLLGTALFSIFYSVFTVFSFVALLAFSQPIMFLAVTTLSFDLIEKESPERHFSYILDQQLYLNLGRAVGIAGFLVSLLIFSNEITLRFIPFLFAIPQMLLLLTSHKVEKQPKVTFALAETRAEYHQTP